MRKVLIAEDEMLVRMGLSVSVDWDRLDLMIVAETTNGSDAFEAFRANRPELVITDLRMPGMDGVTLIRKIREIDRKCAIIVISCLTDFETLHDVMKLGISSYLIKATMTQKNVLEAIEKALGDMDGSAHEASDERERQRRKAADEAWNAYAVARSMTYDPFRRALADAGIREPAPAPVLAVYPPEDKQLERIALLSLRRTVDRCFGASDGPHLAKGGRMAFIAGSEACRDAARDAAVSEVYKYALDNFQIKLRFVICVEPIPAKAVPAFWDAADAYQALDYLFDSPALCVDAKFDVAERDVSEWLDALKDQSLQMRRSPALYGEYIAATDALRASLSLGRAEALRRVYEVTSLLARANPAISPDSLARCHEYLAQAATLGSMISIVDKHILSISAPPTTAYSHLMAGAIQLIAENLAGDITLNSVAASVNLSPGYFSTLLKQETGMRFSEFLSHMRITKAQSLLRETALSINEISALCGFTDIAYFSRCFKARAGMSPSRWRKQC